MSVPLMDIAAQYGPLRAEIDSAITSVLDSGRFILGPNVRALEEEAAAELDGRPCVGVANGTDALCIALQALDVGPGDEVITSPYTFYATAEAVARLGARPVFVDIDPGTYCIDPDAVAEAIGPATKAILPVHIFGHPAAMGRLRRIADDAGLPMVEDAAQAFGAAEGDARVCTVGDLATLSFFPTKNLPGFGDGGMVVCATEELAERVRRLRFHGSADKVVFEEVGYNSRLDELQAAIVRIFLRNVDSWNDGRRAAAAAYAESGLGEHVVLPASGPDAHHVYHLYVVRHPERDALRAALAERGIGAAVYYGVPLHLQPVFAHLGYAPGELPVAEERAATGLAIPMHPNLGEADVAEVAAAVSEAVASLPASAGA
jgi:dTDP-4-amino-4,6-dideoxygalactose transaminase